MDPYLSEIRLFSMSFAPKGWALCNGQLLPINQNQALFSLLGTTYGGDGRVNFALPDLRGRVALHHGDGYTLGERAGEEAHTVTVAELPEHRHGLQAAAAAQDGTGVRTPAGNLLQPALDAYGPPTDLVALEPSSVAQVGGSQAHLNLMPSLALNFCIALQGIFPSQN